jgi:hypothetical protein
MNAKGFLILIAVTFVAAAQLPGATFNIANGDLTALKNAIATANSNGEDDIIELAANGSYVLADVDSGYDGLPTVMPDGGKALTIHGNGSLLQRSTASGTAQFRILDIEFGGNVTISDLGIANGITDYGGAIYNRGTLALNNCTFNNNSALLGGAIYNDGNDGSATLTVQNCAFSNNFGGQYGGAILNDGDLGNATLTVVGSTFNNNSSDEGGAICNSIQSSGGGNAVVDVSNCTFTTNSAFGGGAVASDGYGSPATMTVSNCTFNSNSTQSGGVGGAIYCRHSDIALTNVTLVGNVAGAGGGAIYNTVGFGPSVTLTNCTLSNNSAATGGGIYNNGADSGSARTALRSTILKAGTSGANIFNSSPGTVESSGYNISDDNGSGFLTATGDQISTDPLLDPAGLEDNGGPSQTIALQYNSPAIDKGTSAGLTGTLTTDQRGTGFARVVNEGIPQPAGGDGTDVGAFEFGAGPIAPTSVVSRKFHGSDNSAPYFDLPLPLSCASAGIECRRNSGSDANGPNVGHDDELIVTFGNILGVSGVDVATGKSGDGTTASFAVSNNVVTVDLHNVPNARKLTINLRNVSDGTNSGLVSIPVGVLLGDLNGSARVDAADVSLVRQQSLQTITTSNFREDVNASGRIDAADVSVVRQQTLTSLP